MTAKKEDVLERMIPVLELLEYHSHLVTAYLGQLRSLLQTPEIELSDKEIQELLSRIPVITPTTPITTDAVGVPLSNSGLKISQIGKPSVIDFVNSQP